MFYSMSSCSDLHMNHMSQVDLRCKFQLFLIWFFLLCPSILMYAMAHGVGVLLYS